MFSDKSSVKFKQKETLIAKMISGMLASLSKELPLFSQVFVTRIVLSKDLSASKVYLFSGGGEAVVKEFVKTLIPYVPSIKHALSQNLDWRKTPGLRFMYDDHYEKIVKIEKLIDSAEK